MSSSVASGLSVLKGALSADRAAGLVSAAKCVHRASADLRKLLTVV